MMAKPPTRKTPRLLLRAPEPADVEPLFAIQGDPEAMRFTYCSPSREATATRLAEYADRFTEDGFAPWTVVLLESDSGVAQQRVIGWGGLNKDPAEPEWGIEVAYYFDRSYWDRGLATELVRESLAYAFEELGLDYVGAFTKLENVASARVLLRTGFERIRFVPELERDEYRISKESWSRPNN
jgi:ribosomal-protein-alanine N-acetyltransferase